MGSALALIGGVLFNALAMQSGEHPSPLFGAARGSSKAGEAKAGEAKAPDAKSEVKVAHADAGRSEVAPAQVLRVAPPVRPASALSEAPAAAAPVSAPPKVVAKPQREAARDPIGDLIAGGVPRPPANVPVTTASVAPARAAGPAAAAQRALAKLGFGDLKADGIIGPGTRAAIERFEKSKGLPVTGELNPKTVKALAAASGISIH